MSVHVCDGYGGSEQMTLWCVVCASRTVHDVGYVGSRCHTCGLDWSPMDGELLALLQHVKRMNGWTWDDVGDKLGLAGSTVRTYAWKHNPVLVDHLSDAGIITMRPEEVSS